jgi:hypothetical protein
MFDVLAGPCSDKKILKPCSDKKNIDTLFGQKNRNTLFSQKSFIPLSDKKSRNPVWTKKISKILFGQKNLKIPFRTKKSWTFSEIKFIDGPFSYKKSMPMDPIRRKFLRTLFGQNNFDGRFSKEIVSLKILISIQLNQEEKYV